MKSELVNDERIGTIATEAALEFHSYKTSERPVEWLLQKMKGAARLAAHAVLEEVGVGAIVELGESDTFLADARYLAATGPILLRAKTEGEGSAVGLTELGSEYERSARINQELARLATVGSVREEQRIDVASRMWKTFKEIEARLQSLEEQVKGKEDKR